MPAVTRLGDNCTGHGCYGPRPAVSASPDVFANGIPVHRKNDSWVVHCCGPSCHSGLLAKGSSTVFVNGLDIARIGDPIDCGSASAEGSPDVFSN